MVVVAVSRQACSVFTALVALAGCASLAVNPCDTIEDRDGKYFGRFFLGVATLGLSEVTIQQEEVRQAYQGSPGCPPPPGVRVVTAPKPAAASAPSAAVGTLVNGTRWTIGLYLNQDPGAPGVAPFAILRPERQPPGGLPPRPAFHAGPPDRRPARDLALGAVEPPVRDRSPGAGLQAAVQRGGFQVGAAGSGDGARSAVGSTENVESPIGVAARVSCPPKSRCVCARDTSSMGVG